MSVGLTDIPLKQYYFGSDILIPAFELYFKVQSFFKQNTNYLQQLN